MEVAFLKDIVILLVLSTIVNLVFAKFKVPTIVGFLITGIIVGPHLLGLIHSPKEIDVIAEIGVVLLLFTIGMEFSLKHLLKIRKIVFLGGLFQMVLTSLVFFFVTKFYDMSWQSGLFIGFLTALSSSALVLKLLQERSELTSNYGRTTLGILIFQDLMLVPLLLFANFLGSESPDITHELGVLFIKMLIIIGIVYIGNKWIIPKLLHIIALLKNQEIFMLSIFMICMVVSLATHELGMSMAFGAFLAGLMISESEYSHNAFGNLMTFKDLFTSFFFISVGMMLDVSFVIENYEIVILSVLLVIGIKSFVGSVTGFLLGHTFRGTIIVGFAIAQVGEFSFILAKIGLQNSILTSYYYQLFLAVAVVTMILTPFLMSISLPLANLMLKLPLPKTIVNGLFPLAQIDIPQLKEHMVVIGKDSVALKISLMAQHTKMPHVSIVFDPATAREKSNKGDMVVYGDAVNIPILEKAYVRTADIIVVSIGSSIPTLAVVENIRKLNKTAHVIVRARHIETIDLLYKLGADQVVPENFELAVDMFQRVLSKRLVPIKESNRIISSIRNDYLGIYSEKGLQNKASILEELSHIEIQAIIVEHNSEFVGKTLRQSELRRRTGVTLLAIKRDKKIYEHPELDFKFKSEDIAFVLGNHEQINAAVEVFTMS